MRKLILQMQMSIDGFVSSSDSKLDWLVWDWSQNWTWDEKLKDEFNRIFKHVDCILLSPKMAEEGYIDHWKKAEQDGSADRHFEFANIITNAKEVIFSSTMKASKWPKTEISDEPLVTKIAKLKAEPGSDIIAFGGVTFASALVSAGVVDEFQFFINPRVLGTGRSVFKQGGRRKDLQLLASESYDCGIVVNKYREL